MLLTLILNLSMTGAVTTPEPLDYYPFECGQTYSIIEKETQTCLKITIDSLNTCNKITFNSLNNCS